MALVISPEWELAKECQRIAVLNLTTSGAFLLADRLTRRFGNMRCLVLTSAAAILLSFLLLVTRREKSWWGVVRDPPLGQMIFGRFSDTILPPASTNRCLLVQPIR